MASVISSPPALSLRRALVGGLAVLIAAALARAIAIAAVATVIGADLESADPALRHDGLLIGVGILAGAIAGGAALAIVVRDAPRALAMVPVAPRVVIAWLLAAIALVATVDVAAWLVGRPLLDAAWVDAYRTAPVPLLAIALVITSIFEELYFRGLLQGALASTRVGPAGGIAIVALLFTLAHFPGDPWRFADVLASSVLLGVARQVTGSTLPGMIPHVLGNMFVLVVLALST
jgi:membrane protease YdiL (CAAX protease family)